MNQRTLQRVYLKKIRESSPTFECIFEANFSHTDFPIFEYEENNETVKISYPAAKKRIKEVAKALEEKINKRDVFIGLNMETSPNWVIGFWAILMSGNKPYLINLRHPKELTKGILDTLDIEYLLSDGNVEEFGLTSIQISSLNSDASDYHPTFANEIALSTSGTTMNEKICLYTGKEILAQLSNTETVLKISKEVKRMYKKTIKLLAFLPFYHIFGLITVYFWFTYFGYAIVFLKDYSSQNILHTIRKHEVTHIFGVPLLWHTIEAEVRKEVAKRDEKTQKKFNDGIKKINKVQNINFRLGMYLARKGMKEIRNALFGDSPRLCISGGSYIKDSTLELLSGIGYPVYNGYGTSEIGITSVELAVKPKYRLLNSVGKPFKSVTYKIEDGTLRVKGDSTCHEVIVNKERIKTEEWFDTLDMAHMDDNGRYYIDGRRSDLIITDDGENVNPDEIEKHFDFSSFPVLYFSVLSLNKEKNDITLVIEPSKKLIKEEVDSLKEYIDSVNKELPYSHKVKNIYMTYDDIQNRNAIKVSRAYLINGVNNHKIRLSTLEEINSVDESLNSSLMETLIDIFAEALNLDRSFIKPDSHFLYDLNGTSLDYYNLLYLVNNRFNTNITFNPDDPLVSPRDFEKYLMELNK